MTKISLNSQSQEGESLSARCLLIGALVPLSLKVLDRMLPELLPLLVSYIHATSMSVPCFLEKHKQTNAKNEEWRAYLHGSGRGTARLRKRTTS